MIRLHRRLEPRDHLPVLLHDAAHVVPADAERADRRGRPRRGAARRAGQDGHFAEEGARADACHAPLAVRVRTHDIDVAAAEEIRIVAALSLFQDHVTRGEADRREVGGQVRDRLGRQVGERAVAPQEVRRRPQIRECPELLGETGLARDDREQRVLGDAHAGAGRGRDHARVPRLIEDRGHLADEGRSGHGRKGAMTVPGHDPDAAKGQDDDVPGWVALPDQRLARREGRTRARGEQPLANGVRKAEERSEIEHPHSARA